MRGAVSPPNNTGDGLHGDGTRRRPAGYGRSLVGSDRATPGDTFQGQPRSRGVRLERTRPRSIIVNRAGKRFLNGAGEYNSMAGPFQYLDPRDGYANDPAWIVFDSLHLKRYGFLGVAPGEPAPDWFSPSADLAELGTKTGINADGLARTLTAWNDNVAHEADPDLAAAQVLRRILGRRPRQRPRLARRWVPSTPPRTTQCRCRSAQWVPKGGPRTDSDGRVLHVSGSSIPGLYAAGNAMAGATGKAYGGAGGTLGPAMVFGYRAGLSVSPAVNRPDWGEL
jgi:hypothetical protein